MSLQLTARGVAVIGERSVLPRSPLPAKAVGLGILVSALLASPALAESITPDPRVIKAPSAASQATKSAEASPRAKEAKAKSTTDSKASAAAAPDKPRSRPVPKPEAATRSLATARSGDWALCRKAAAGIEPQIAAPKHLLSAVALTETGRRSPGGKALTAWPWTINVGGKGYVFTTKEEAVRAVRRLLSQGHRSIDVGCMQVNLKYHPRAFTSLEEAFDPVANIAYGASFLARLKRRHGNWDLAVQHYHSYTEEYRERYAARFKTLWALERRRMAKATVRASGDPSARVANGARLGRADLLGRLAELPRSVVRAALPNLTALRRLEPVAEIVNLGMTFAAAARPGEEGRRFLLRLAGNYPKIAETRTRSAALNEPVTVN